LVAHKQKVSVFTTTANGPEELMAIKNLLQESDGVFLWRFNRWTGDHSHFSPTLLLHFWRNCRDFDIIHIHSWWNLVAVFTLGICRLRGIRPVVSLRGMLSPYTLRSRLKRLFHQLLGKKMLAGAVLHVTSLREQKDVAVAMHGANIFCLPNLVKLPAYTPKENLTKEPVLRRPLQLLFLGRIHPVKHLELLFNALSNLSIPYRFTIAGAGEPNYEAGLRELAQRLGITEHINWAGWVEGAEKTELLASADVFLLTSHHENFANAALEALALGTPVVLTETIGLANYVCETGFGRVCPPEAQAIASAIADLALNSTGRGRLDIATRVRADFDPDQLALAYIEQYKKWTKD